MLLIDFGNIRKKAERLYIQNSVASMMASQTESNREKAKEAVEEEVSSLKEHLKDDSEKLTMFVSGKFGKQANKALESETEKVDNF